MNGYCDLYCRNKDIDLLICIKNWFNTHVTGKRDLTTYALGRHHLYLLFNGNPPPSPGTQRIFPSFTLKIWEMFHSFSFACRIKGGGWCLKPGATLQIHGICGLKTALKNRPLGGSFNVNQKSLLRGTNSYKFIKLAYLTVKFLFLKQSFLVYLFLLC